TTFLLFRGLSPGVWFVDALGKRRAGHAPSRKRPGAATVAGISTDVAPPRRARQAAWRVVEDHDAKDVVQVHRDAEKFVTMKREPGGSGSAAVPPTRPLAIFLDRQLTDWLIFPARSEGGVSNASASMERCSQRTRRG